MRTSRLVQKGTTTSETSSSRQRGSALSAEIIGDRIGDQQAEQRADRRQHQRVPEGGRAGRQVGELREGEGRLIAAFRRPLAEGEDQDGDEGQHQEDEQPDAGRADKAP